MRFHVNGFAVAALFVVIVLLAIDVRLGIAAIAAGVVLDALSLLGAFGLGRGRDR